MPGIGDLAGILILIVGGIIIQAGKSNPKDLEKGMSQRQKGMFQREIEDYKHYNGMPSNHNLPWEILVAIAEEIRKNFK